MVSLLLIPALVGSISLVAWLWLVVGRGWYWRTDQQLTPQTLPSGEQFDWPAVSVIVPARNEADVLPDSLPTLLQQDYAGQLRVFLVDDRSEDGTSSVAQHLASDADANERLTVVQGEPLTPGWTGKLWALHQGVNASEPTSSEFLLLTDADITHPPDSIRNLVLKAQNQRLDLVSLMARLRVEAMWERLLIPAFVYFFAKLYPFRWANARRRSTAAAAGGCILVRRDALNTSGGLESIASKLIDDCALAGRIKHHSKSPRGGRTWLGLTQDVRSLRTYDGLDPVWDMVARTAYAQLNYSPFILMGTVLGMLLLYLVPPLSAVGGLIALASTQESAMSIWLIAVGLAAWMLMAGSYLPMLRWHDTSPLYAPLLPFVGVLYTLMTIASAIRSWRGKGGAWKGRTYKAPNAPSKRSKATAQVGKEPDHASK